MLQGKEKNSWTNAELRHYDVINISWWRIDKGNMQRTGGEFFVFF